MKHLHLVLMASASALISGAAGSLPTLNIADIFVAGQPAPVGCYRIPALVRTAAGTLIAMAEARATCDDCSHKYVAFRRSVDNGMTWSPVAPLFGDAYPTLSIGNPAVVFDQRANKTLVYISVADIGNCDPGFANVVVDDSGTDGVSWPNVLNITTSMGKYTGGLFGPGTALQLTTGPFAWRILVPIHMGAYVMDGVLYSDDGGKTHNLSTTTLLQMDEPVAAQLANGSIMLNMRNNHLNPSCDCRATSISDDGGVSWSLPVRFDATLISPVCQASLVSMQDASGDTALFFSNPASTTARSDLTIRRSTTDGASWDATTLLVQNGSVCGGYSCMSPAAEPGQGAILLERCPIGVVSFTTFPLTGW